MVKKSIVCLICCVLFCTAQEKSLEKIIAQNDPAFFLQEHQFLHLSPQDRKEWLQQAQGIIDACRDRHKFSVMDLKSSLFGAGHVLIGASLVVGAFFVPTGAVTVSVEQGKDFLKLLGVLVCIRGVGKIIGAIRKEGRYQQLLCACALKEFLKQERILSKKSSTKEKGIVETAH